MKLQSSLYVSSRSNYSSVSTATAQKAATTRTQVTQFTNDVAAKAAKGKLAGFSSSSLPSDTTGDLFPAMVGYQKMMNKEAREDREVAKAGAQLELMEKASKRDQEQSKIAKMRDEAAMANTDVMTLVMCVVRESYLEATEVLKDYAKKVKHFNAQKKEIREHLPSAQKNDGVLTDRLKSGQDNKNIMETLFLVLKESIRESNEIKKYYLEKLSSMNRLSESLSAQQEAIATASQRLAKSEKKDDDD